MTLPSLSLPDAVTWYCPPRGGRERDERRAAVVGGHRVGEDGRALRRALPVEVAVLRLLVDAVPDDLVDHARQFGAAVGLALRRHRNRRHVGRLAGLGHVAVGAEADVVLAAVHGEARRRIDDLAGGAGDVDVERPLLAADGPLEVRRQADDELALGVGRALPFLDQAGVGVVVRVVLRVLRVERLEAVVAAVRRLPVERVAVAVNLPLHRGVDQRAASVVGGVHGRSDDLALDVGRLVRLRPRSRTPA